MRFSTIRQIALACLVLILFTGCAHEAPFIPPGMPDDAIAVKEGIGRLFFQASSEGTIVLYDADTASVVLEQPMIPPARFIFDPSVGTVTVEGVVTFADPSRFAIKLGDHSMKEVSINPKHTHQIYFVAGKVKPASTQP